MIRDADGRERIFIGMNRNGYPAIEMKSSRGARCFNLVVKDPAEAVALLGPEDLRSGALMLYAASGPGELRGAGMRAYSSAAEESGVALMDLRLSEEGRYSHDFESADGEQRISITSDGDGATFSLEEGGGKLSLSSAPQLSMAVEGGETVRIAP